MLHFIDQTSVGNHHMVFNASMVQVLLRIYPNEPITLYGISSNQKSMSEFFTKTDLERISFKEIVYPSPRIENIIFKALNYFQKEIVRKKMFRKLLSSCEVTDLVFLSITTFTSFSYFVKLKIKYKVPTLACLHGDIDFLYNAQNKYEKVNGNVHKKLMKINLSNFKFVLLNKIAKPILLKDGYLSSANVVDIEHPFTDLKRTRLRNKLTNNPIKLAHIGSMEVKRKNSHFIYSLAQQLDLLINEKYIELQTIGLITPLVLPFKNSLVKEIVGNEESDKPKYLSRTDYEIALEQVHYTLFFYPEIEYVFRASGATVDTIAFEKPIFTLKHPYFEYLFRVAGNVGYMFDDLVAMQLKIKEIANNPTIFEKEYNIQCENLKTFKETLTIDSIAQDLLKQIEKLR